MTTAPPDPGSPGPGRDRTAVPGGDGATGPADGSRPADARSPAGGYGFSAGDGASAPVLDRAPAVPDGVPHGPDDEVGRLRADLDAATREVAHLRYAVTTNRRIGMAVGILMALRRCREDDAFDLLRQASNRRNVKLRDVAEDVIRAGTVD